MHYLSKHRLLGQKVNFTNLTAVYTGTTEIKWDDKTTKTIYTDVGFSGYALLALAYFLTSGEPAQAPETFPQPVSAQYERRKNVVWNVQIRHWVHNCYCSLCPY